MEYMELMKLYHKAINMVENAGIAVPDGLDTHQVNFMDRSKTYGLCRWNWNYGEMTAQIFMSSTFVKNGKENDILNCLVHEILHACAESVDTGCHHGGTWKRYANIINRKYSNLNIQRLSRYEDNNGNVALKQAPVRAILKCTKCGYEYKFSRITKSVRDYSKCRCGACHSKLERIL